MKRYIKANAMLADDNIIEIENADAKPTRLDTYVERYGLNFVSLVMDLFWRPEWRTTAPYSDRIAEANISDSELDSMINYIHRYAQGFVSGDLTDFTIGRKVGRMKMSHNHRIYRGDYQEYKKWLGD